MHLSLFLSMIIKKLKKPMNDTKKNNTTAKSNKLHWINELKNTVKKMFNNGKNYLDIF